MSIVGGRVGNSSSTSLSLPLSITIAESDNIRFYLILSDLNRLIIGLLASNTVTDSLLNIVFLSSDNKLCALSILLGLYPFFASRYTSAFYLRKVSTTVQVSLV